MNIQVIEDDKLSEINSKIDTVQKMLSQMEHGQAVSKEWLTVKEASAFLGVTTRSLQKYRDKGLIPFSDFGGKIMIRQIDLHEFLMKHRVDYNLFNNQ